MLQLHLLAVLWSIAGQMATAEPYGTWMYVGGLTTPTNFTFPDKLGVNLGAQFTSYSMNDSYGPNAVTSSCGDIDSATGIIYSFGGYIGTFSWSYISASNALWAFNTSNLNWTWISGEIYNNSLSFNSKGKYPTSLGQGGSVNSFYPSSRTMCSLAAFNNSVFLYGGLGYSPDTNCSGNYFVLLWTNI
jgi:hypothetical protein